MGADIHIWILTGDKRETAVNIAQASALCTSSTTQLVIDTNTYDETYSRLSAFVNKGQALNRSNVEFALIIDGSVSYFLCWVLRGSIIKVDREESGIPSLNSV